MNCSFHSHDPLPPSRRGEGRSPLACPEPTTHNGPKLVNEKAESPRHKHFGAAWPHAIMEAEEPPQLVRLKDALANDAVKSALLSKVVAAIQQQNPDRSAIDRIDYEEALDQADMAILGGMKQDKACKAAATAVLYTLKHTEQSGLATVSLTTREDPTESVWGKLSGFHVALTDYGNTKSYFITDDNASIGPELASTLRLDPPNPRKGFTACLVVTFYSGVLEALLTGLFSHTHSWSVGIGGALVAYSISIGLYVAIVKNAASPGPAIDDPFDESCNCTPQERYQSGAMGVGGLLFIDLVFALQRRVGLLTTPFYLLKAALAGLMLVHMYRLRAEIVSTVPYTA